MYNFELDGMLKPFYDYDSTFRISYTNGKLSLNWYHTENWTNVMFDRNNLQVVESLCHNDLGCPVQMDHSGSGQVCTKNEPVLIEGNKLRHQLLMRLIRKH